MAPAAVGPNLEALVFATLRWDEPGTVSAFDESVATFLHVLQAQCLFGGEPDYLLRVAITDLAAPPRSPTSVSNRSSTKVSTHCPATDCSGAGGTTRNAR